MQDKVLKLTELLRLMCTSTHKDSNKIYFVFFSRFLSISMKILSKITLFKLILKQK
jgi:hypothetical protein